MSEHSETVSVHICRPPSFAYRTVIACPTCGQRRRFLADSAGWWGTTYTCLTCGDAWADGERLPRPFARGWRAKAVRAAKAHPYTSRAKARAAEWRYLFSDEAQP